jgi:hypothetical protein
MKKLLLILLIPTFAISAPYKDQKLLLTCVGEETVNYCQKYKSKYMTKYNGCKANPKISKRIDVTVKYITRTKEELTKKWQTFPKNKTPIIVEFKMPEGYIPDFDQPSIAYGEKNSKKLRAEWRERDKAEGKTISAWSKLYDKYDSEKTIDYESSSERFMGKWEEVRLEQEKKLIDGNLQRVKNGKTFLETSETYFEIDRMRGTLKTKHVRKKLSYFDKDENGELIDELLENEQLVWFEDEFYGDCSKVSNEQKF